MNSTRLLHLIKTFDIGGVERSTINSSNQLVNRIDFVGIFAHKGIFNHSNIVKSKVSQFYSIGKLSNPLFFVINLIMMFRIIICNKINIINYHQRVLIPYILLIRLFFPTIKIVYSHHNIFNDSLNNFLKADIYLAFSIALKHDLEKVSKSPIVLLNHKIDIIENRSSINETINVIGYVGRFEKLKGIYLLLDAFINISNEFSNLNLVIIGDGKEKSAIKKYIAQCNIVNKVIVKDPEIDLAEIYKGIDCLVVPSGKKEGFGLVIIEAMGNKIPVVASDLEPFKEIIKNNITGLLFERGKVESLIIQLNRVITDNKLRTDIIRNGFEYVSKYFKMGV